MFAFFVRTVLVFCVCFVGVGLAQEAGATPSGWTLTLAGVFSAVVAAIWGWDISERCDK